MRKVIKINERITLMIDNHSVNILDDKTFIPMNINDLKLILDNLELDDEKEKPKSRSRARTQPKAEEVPIPLDDDDEEVPPPNPFK